MSNIVNAWNNTRLSYQLRYSDMCKKLKSRFNNGDHAAMLEMSYVLISVFGLTPCQVGQVERNGGLTDEDVYGSM